MVFIKSKMQLEPTGRENSSTACVSGNPLSILGTSKHHLHNAHGPVRMQSLCSDVPCRREVNPMSCFFYLEVFTVAENEEDWQRTCKRDNQLSGCGFGSSGRQGLLMEEICICPTILCSCKKRSK